MIEIKTFKNWNGSTLYFLLSIERCKRFGGKVGDIIYILREWELNPWHGFRSRSGLNICFHLPMLFDLSP